MPAANLMVFDLDGTLMDTVRDLVPALNRATAPDGLPPLALHDVGHVVGQGAMAMIARAYALHERPLSAERHQIAFDAFLREYEARIAEETIWFPHILEALDALEQDGWRFAVCTNKNEGMARRIMEEMGSGGRFAALTGGDTFTFKKPDPRHILETVALAGGDPARCIMVGDSINDIAAAQAAPMPSIAVTFGYTEQPVTEMGATAVIDTFADLHATAQRIAADF